MMFQVPGGTDIAGIVPDMVRYRLAGCIVIPTVSVSRRNLSALAHYNIPVVLLNRRMRGANAFSSLAIKWPAAAPLPNFLSPAVTNGSALLQVLTPPRPLVVKAGS